jgi:hypothetical protein
MCCLLLASSQLACADIQLAAQVIGCPLEPDLGMGDMGGSIDMRGGMGMMDGYGMTYQGGGYGDPHGQHGFMPHARDYATASHGAACKTTSSLYRCTSGLRVYFDSLLVIAAAMHGQSSSWGSTAWNAGMRSSSGGGANVRVSGSPARRAGRGGRPA